MRVEKRRKEATVEEEGSECQWAVEGLRMVVVVGAMERRVAVAPFRLVVGLVADRPDHEVA
jgi:hypothetical protein